MNHNELSELRAQIKPDAKHLYISSLAAACITVKDASPLVQSFQIYDFSQLPETEQELYCRMFKKVLSGRMGKSLVEYDFVLDEEGNSRFQQILYTLNQSRLKDEELVRKFVDQFIQCTGYTGSYYLTLACCEYQVPVKDKNNEVNPEDVSQIHRFLLGACNEISLTDIGLYYNEEENTVEKKEDVDLQVLPAVRDGFMYPSFTDRHSDVNHVLYYTRTPKKPNDLIIENVLGAKCGLSHDMEKEAFKKFMGAVASDELTLDLISHVQGSIRDFVSESSEGSEMETISKIQMKNLLAQSGLSAQKLNLFNAAYDDAIGEEELKAINVLDTEKMQVKVPDITVTVKGDGLYKVKTKVIDGKLTLCIDIDDTLQVNGMEVMK